MRELEMKEKKIKEIQNTGDRLLREDHPARPTVEVGARWQGPWEHLWGWGCGTDGPGVGPKDHVVHSPSRLPCRHSGAGCYSCVAALKHT